MQGESAEDKRERLRQRSAAERERTMAAQQTASDLDTDLSSVYGRISPSIFDTIGMPAKPKTSTKRSPINSGYTGR